MSSSTVSSVPRMRYGQVVQPYILFSRRYLVDGRGKTAGSGRWWLESALRLTATGSTRLRASTVTRPAILSVLLALLAGPAAAQGLRDQFAELFRFGGSCGDVLLCLNDASGASVANAFTAPLSENNQLIIGFVSQAIGQSVANIPVPATSSGTIPEFVAGRLVPRSLSAGPIYAERAPTLGRNRLMIGTYFTYLDFDALRGVPLDDMVFNFQHVDLPGSGPLGDPEQENNILQVQTDLAVRLLAASVFVTYGLTNWLDVGVAVPFVRTSISGRSRAQIVPFGTNTVYSFGDRPPSADPQLQQTNFVEGSATGVGDIAGRAKLNLYQSRRSGVAILADVRFPTGDEKELLGLGYTQVRGLAIVSAEFGSFSPHVNVGYRYLDQPAPLQNHAVLGNLGFDLLITPGVTVIADALSEWHVDEMSLTVPESIQYREPFTRSVPASPIPDRRDDRLDGSFGFKFTPRAAVSGLTVVLSSLIPLNSGGMRSDATWTLGVEYKF